jgi:16S rRNA (guanine(527)-N(7))-methyltransferase RsmG
MDAARIADLLRPFLLDPGADSSAAWSATEDAESSSFRAVSAPRTCTERGRRESASLTPSQLQDISTYIDILLRWNARINLTAVRDPEEIVTRHFGESLFAARHLFPLDFNTGCGPGLRPGPTVPACSSDHVGTDAPVRPAERSSAEDLGAPPLSRSLRQGGDVARVPHPSIVAREGYDFSRANQLSTKTGASAPEGPSLHLIDIGSGAGFPGLPIKIFTPEIRLTLVESNHKKATFLREVARALTLTNVNVLSARAEDLLKSGSAPQADVVTLRAVERFEEAIITAAALVAPGGRLALLIGSSQLASTQAVAPAILWQSPILVPGSTNRILLIGPRRA